LLGDESADCDPQPRFRRGLLFLMPITRMAAMAAAQDRMTLPIIRFLDK
jgi:hypothetical protein